MRSQSLYLVTGVNKFSNLQKPKPCKTKFEPIAPCAREFSRALNKLQIIARNSDWFMALFALVVIVAVITLVLVFPQTFENALMGIFF